MSPFTYEHIFSWPYVLEVHPVCWRVVRHVACSGMPTLQGTPGPPTTRGLKRGEDLIGSKTSRQIPRSQSGFPLDFLPRPPIIPMAASESGWEPESWTTPSRLRYHKHSPVAQRWRGRLLTAWLEVRILPGEPRCRQCTSSTLDHEVQVGVLLPAASHKTSNDLLPA